MAAFDPVTLPPRRRLAAGLTVGQLRGPGYRQLLRGVHVSSEVEVDVRVRARAALLVAPEGAAIARHTACELWDGWPRRIGAPIVLPSGQDSRSARMVGQAVDARASRSADGITTLAGIRLTDRVRTFLDLAADCDLVDLVAVGDSLVRRDRLDPRRLREAAATPGRHRLLARRAAALVRPRVMSRPESQLRMLLVLAGLPEPSVDVQFSDPDGRLVRRLDLGYRDHRVAVEYDGSQHADDQSSGTPTSIGGRTSTTATGASWWSRRRGCGSNPSARWPAWSKCSGPGVQTSTSARRSGRDISVRAIVGPPEPLTGPWSDVATCRVDVARKRNQRHQVAMSRVCVVGWRVLGWGGRGRRFRGRSPTIGAYAACSATLETAV